MTYSDKSEKSWHLIMFCLESNILFNPAPEFNCCEGISASNKIQIKVKKITYLYFIN